MDVPRELFCQEIGRCILEAFPEMETDIKEAANLSAVAALQEIAAILRDDNRDDFVCVDEIIRTLEKHGISCGVRHDFG